MDTITPFRSPALPNGRTYRLLVLPHGKRGRRSLERGDGQGAMTDDAYEVYMEYPNLAAAYDTLLRFERPSGLFESMYIGAYEGGVPLMWVFCSPPKG